MRITRLDREAETVAFDSIGPEDSPKAAREFCVTSRKAPFLYKGRYRTAGCIWRLLVESIETGNPIRWDWPMPTITLEDYRGIGPDAPDVPVPQ